MFEHREAVGSPAPDPGCNRRGRTRSPQSRSRLATCLRAATSLRRRGFCRIRGLRKAQAKNDAEARRAYHDVYRDINFAGHRTWAKLQATTGKAPVWIYVFSHIPPRPEGNGNNPPAPAGAVHFSEVIYVFNNLRMKDYPWTDLDRKIADTLATYWTSFTKAANPNGTGLVNWPAYNPRNEYWLNIGDTIRMERFDPAGVDLIAAVQEEIRRGRQD